MMTWWQNAFLGVSDGRLTLAGRDAAELADREGTPLFVYGRTRIRENFDRLAAAFAALDGLETRICYAMKANPHSGILRFVRGLGAWVDAVSPGEVEAARKAGFPASRILFTGTSVGVADLRRVFREDGITINIDAPEQIEILREVRREFPGRRKIRASLRWNPGSGRGFTAGVVTAGRRSTDGTPIKFGIEPSKLDTAFTAASAAGFQPVGLHQHLGSGWTAEDYRSVASSVDRMVRKAADLEKTGIRLEFLDFGGGFGPRYHPNQGVFPVEAYAERIGRRMKEAGLHVKTIAVEPGKFLVGDAGVLLLRINYVKESFGQIFACVDGGTFTSVPRPAIYPGAYHEILNATRLAEPRRTRVTVAGNLCETGDVFAKSRPLPTPRRGDVLAVLCAGAYCRSMASRFNLREIPREILV